MSARQPDWARIQHMLDAIQAIQSYTVGKTFESFLSDDMARMATVKQLEIIGEASNHLADSSRREMPHVPWPEIRGLRNMLVHEYFGIDFRIVWDIVQVELAPLETALTKWLSENS